MSKFSSMLWGILLVVVGLVFGLRVLGIADINIFFNGWWTLFIIVPCLIDLFKDKDKTGNIIGLIIGVLLFLGCNDLIDFGLIFKLMIPVILVVSGLSIIFKDMLSVNIRKKMESITRNEEGEYYATFAGQNLDFANEEFTGCKLNAIFGGIKCDLRDAKIDKDVVIDATAVFGGITLYVPKNVNVSIVGNSIFGGVEDERKNVNKDNKVTVYLNANSMFGGVDIK